jgi:hypothetical protein
MYIPFKVWCLLPIAVPSGSAPVCASAQAQLESCTTAAGAATLGKFGSPFWYRNVTRKCFH